MNVPREERMKITGDENVQKKQFSKSLRTLLTGLKEYS
jgi:hypothetical protein